jgi:hypothetical protein
MSKALPTFPHFADYACDGDTVSFEYEGFTFTATLYRDDDCNAPDEQQEGFWPSLDPNDAGYIGAKSKSTLARHMAKAREVLATWRNDEWWYVGVAVTVEKEGVQLTSDYEHALWGIECNYPFGKKSNHYLSSRADEYVGEALKTARAKIAKLIA